MSLYHLNIGYAALLTAGGLIGFLSKGSLPSLVAGAGSGVLVAAFTHLNWPYKTLAVTVISAGLGYVMANKYQATHKFMPAGLIALMSVVVFLAQVRHWYIMNSPH
ncbi:unnamed protein product, partial [Mesorhabditis belari]|uniref:Transmembrane protein 14C n=1 Tax=Mesorhabditis belari TaxID=2138241 RepID=A0AAF3ETB8_9BILA